jgi:hypothetical protein
LEHAPDGVLGTVDQLVVDNTIMDEVKKKEAKPCCSILRLSITDMARHNWMLQVYRLPTDEGKENKVRGHRQRRSGNKQIDKHPERYSIGPAIFW